MLIADSKPVAPFSPAQIDAARAALHEHDAAWRAAWAQFSESFAALQTTARQHGVKLRHGTDELQFDRLSLQLDTFRTGEELDLALGRAVVSRQRAVEHQEARAREEEAERQRYRASVDRLTASLNKRTNQENARAARQRREALTALGEADAA